MFDEKSIFEFISKLETEFKKKERSKYVEVAKITPKEFAGFIKSRTGLQILESLMKSLMDVASEIKGKDDEWWERIYDKYNLDSNDDFRVNREKMTLEKRITLEDVSTNNKIIN